MVSFNTVVMVSVLVAGARPPSSIPAWPAKDYFFSAYRVRCGRYKSCTVHQLTIVPTR